MLPCHWNTLNSFFPRSSGGLCQALHLLKLIQGCRCVWWLCWYVFIFYFFYVAMFWCFSLYRYTRLVISLYCLGDLWSIIPCFSFNEIFLPLNEQEKMESLSQSMNSLTSIDTQFQPTKIPYLEQEYGSKPKQWSWQRRLKWVTCLSPQGLRRVFFLVKY